MNMKNEIQEFFAYTSANHIKFYNEICFQIELIIYLRTKYPEYKILPEINAKKWNITHGIKKEIDIVVEINEHKKIAIELKYPVNGQHPEQMYSFITDIKFCEQLSQNCFFKSYSICLVKDPLFFSGNIPSEIYNYFRNSKEIHGKIFKPTGPAKTIDFIHIEGFYKVKWNSCIDNCHKYYIIET